MNLNAKARKLSVERRYIFGSCAAIVYVAALALAVWLGVKLPQYSHFGYLLFFSGGIAVFTAMIRPPAHEVIAELVVESVRHGSYIFIVMVTYQAIDEKLPILRFVG